MSRTAFVFGSNGPESLGPLKYAGRDAKRVAACLAQPTCAFAVHTPSPGARAVGVRDQLATLAEAASPSDTFVCFFSGHGLLWHGRLYLLWDDTEQDRLLTTAIPIAMVMESLRYCRAANKLLILDCCHAGAVVAAAGFKDAAGIAVADLDVQPDNHLVLMASDRLERTRELESLQAGFLTAHLCSALTDQLVEADLDGDGTLSIRDLTLWLESRAVEHNNGAREQVPIPYLFGQQRGDLRLALGKLATHLTLSIEQRGTQLTITAVEPGRINTETRTATTDFPTDVGETVRAHLLRAVLDHNGGTAVGVEQLAQVGSSLFDGFLAWLPFDPIANLPVSMPIQLRLDGSVSGLPWEVLRVNGAFLALSHPFVRTSLDQVRPRRQHRDRTLREPLKVLLVDAQPVDELPGARPAPVDPEVGVIQDALSPYPATTTVRRGSWDDVIAAASERMDAIHFIGHAHYDRARNEAGVVLADRAVITATDLGNLAAPPRLLVSSGCSAAEAPWTTEVYAGAAAQIQFSSAAVRHGSETAMAALWVVSPQRFMHAFYQALGSNDGRLDALSVARAATHARRECYRNHDMAWAAYALHGELA